MANVFISYSKKDAEKVARLEDALVALKVSVWRDKDVDPGDNWGRTIEREIDCAKALLVCWSQSAIESDGVLEEVERAKKRSIPIQSVALESPGTLVLPYGFMRTQAENCSNWDGSFEHEGFLKTLKSLGEKIGRPDLARHYDDWLARQKETAEALARKAAADKLRAETERRIKLEQEETEARIKRKQKAETQAELDKAKAEFTAVQRRRFEDLPVTRIAKQAQENADRCKQELERSSAAFRDVDNLALVELKEGVKPPHTFLGWGCSVLIVFWGFPLLAMTIGFVLSLLHWTGEDYLTHDQLVFWTWTIMIFLVCLLLACLISFNPSALSRDSRANRVEKAKGALSKANAAHHTAQAAADEAWKPFQRGIDAFELKRPGA